MRTLFRAWMTAGLVVALGMAGAQAEERPEDRPVVDTEVGRLVYRELRSAYGAKNRPAYERAVKALASADAEQRRFGGEYLLALCKQTLWDERHGLTPRSTGWKIGGRVRDGSARIEKGEIPRVARHEPPAPMGPWQSHGQWVLQR
jgi:hypothetical protein